MDAATEVNRTNGSTRSGISGKIPPVPYPLAEEPAEIASNISFHAKYSPHFSPFKFEPEQAYFSTAESVRDRLIQVELSLLRITDGCFFPFLIRMIFLMSGTRLHRYSLHNH